MGSALEVGKAREELVGRHGPLAEDDRGRTCEIDHRGRRPCERPSVDDRRDGAADLGGNVLRPLRVGPAGEVGARRDEGALPARVVLERLAVLTDR